MKLLLATAITAALLAGVFLIPIDGHTVWQQAEARGLPQSAARAMSNGAHAAVKWAEEKNDKQGHRDADAPPVRKPVRREIAKASPPAQHSPYLDAHQPAEAPSAAHDRIVPAPPEEKLSDGDRQGLDKLIAGAGKK